MANLFAQGYRRIFLLILISVFLFTFRLGDRSFRNPDEGRYAEIAREMVVSGNWVEPTLYGVDYLRKPIFFYWLVAASFKAFGFNEWSARAVPAFFGLLGILATYLFARRRFGTEKAFCAAILLATNVWYIQVSRYLLIDAVFCFFLIGVFYSAWEALEKGGRHRVFLFYVFLALGFLTKGVAGLAVPFVAFLLYFSFTRQILRGLRLFLSPVGILLFLAISVPWFAAVSAREPEFLRFFFWHEHVTRFVSKGFEHQEPWFYYLVLLPLVFFPWSFFWGPLRDSFGADRRAPRDVRFFLQMAFIGTLLFYSLSRSKLATYLLPMMPLGCLLLADALTPWIGSGRPFRKKLFYSCLFVLSFASVAATLIMERVNDNYTTKHFAEELDPKLAPDSRVYIYDHPGAFYDFAFYLHHPVKLIGLGGELELSPKDEKTSRAVVTRDQWKDLLMREKAYCLMRRSDYNEMDSLLKPHLIPLLEDKRKILLETVV